MSCASTLCPYGWTTNPTNEIQHLTTSYICKQTSLLLNENLQTVRVWSLNFGICIRSAPRDIQCTLLSNFSYERQLTHGQLWSEQMQQEQVVHIQVASLLYTLYGSNKVKCKIIGLLNIPISSQQQSLVSVM